MNARHPTGRRGFDPVWVLTSVWIFELDALIHRHPELCIEPDTVNMSLVDLWGIYMFLLAKEA